MELGVFALETWKLAEALFLPPPSFLPWLLHGPPSPLEVEAVGDPAGVPAFATLGTLDLVVQLMDPNPRVAFRGRTLQREVSAPWLLGRVDDVVLGVVAWLVLVLVVLAWLLVVPSRQGWHAGLLLGHLAGGVLLGLLLGRLLLDLDMAGRLQGGSTLCITKSKPNTNPKPALGAILEKEWRKELAKTWALEAAAFAEAMYAASAMTHVSP